MVDKLPEIIDILNKLGLRELLDYINLKKLSGQAFEYAIKRIKELWNKKQYGFTPSKEEATKLKQISKLDLYLRLKFCLGHHWSLPLIKVGIYISNLNEDGQAKLVQQTREYVLQKNGILGLRVIELGSTSVLKGIIEHISDLKIRKNYNRSDLVREFEKILYEWKKITIFVKNEDTIEIVMENIKNQINIKNSIFFVFAFGNASKIAMNAIAKANNDGIIKEGGYLFSTKYWINKKGSEIYSWTFELVDII